jgi:TetR/AcrR family transcriptional regulator, transcriptional repressor of bet genes
MPKIVDHHRRREDLALLTLKVISAVGIENATLREIARRGALSLGRLTHYFGSKDDLLAFAFRWLTEKSFAELDRLATVHPPGRPRLEAAVDAMSRFGEPAGIGVWLSIWERATRNPAFANEHRAFYARWRSYVRTCLSDALGLRPRARPTGLDEATDLIVAAVDGLWIGGAFEPERFAAVRRRALLRLQLDALTRSLTTAAERAASRRAAGRPRGTRPRA